MKLGFGFLAVVAVTLLSACTGPGWSVRKEREAFLADPTLPRYAFDGAMVGGSHYLYLAGKDAGFGEWLLATVPTSNDPNLVAAALSYFAWKKPDREKFERVVREMKASLLKAEVADGNTDVIWTVTLAELIEEIRGEKKWAEAAAEKVAGSVRRITAGRLS